MVSLCVTELSSVIEDAELVETELEKQALVELSDNINEWLKKSQNETDDSSPWFSWLHGDPLTDSFPIKTMSHFKLIEKLVAESIVCRKNLIKKLRLIGGRHPRAMVYNILQRLLSDEVAEKFTYMGMRSNKYKFKDTVLCKIIRAAVTPDCTEEVLKSVIGDWLVQAKFRKIRKQMKDEKSLTEENGDRDFTF